MKTLWVTLAIVMLSATLVSAKGFQFFLLATGADSDDLLATSGTTFLAVSGVGADTGTEANVRGRLNRTKPMKLSCSLSVAPGAGKSYTVMLRHNTADTDCTCSIADTNTACSDTSCSVLAASAAFALAFTAVSTPTASTPRCYIIGMSL